MGVGGVGSGNQTVDTGEGTTGPQPGEGTDAGPNGPGGTGEGNTGTTGTEGGEGGLDFAGDFGFGTDVVSPDVAGEEASDAAATRLCNTIALRCTEDASARNQIIGSHDDNTRANEGDRADARLTTDSDTYRSDSRTDVRTSSFGDALTSGDRRVIDNLFKNLMGGGREGANPSRTGSNPNPTGTPNPNPGANPMAPRAGTPTGNPSTGTNPPPTNPPIFPNATGRLATLTQPRMDGLPGRIANMPDGANKTQAQQLETRLRAAVASGNREEAAQIMDQLAALGVEVGGEEATEETHEDAEVGEGDGESEGTGEGGTTGRTGEGGEGATPRLAGTRFSTDTLNTGVMVFHGGGGGNAEGGDHLTRMGTGLRTVLGGRGTEAAVRLSTDDAVRGVLYDGGNGDGDSAGGGGSRDSSVEFGSMVDTDGALASSGLRLDTAAAGLGGSYGVRTEDGRFIPQWMAMSEHGGLPPGVRAAIGRDAALRTRFGAEAVSGASAGRTGDLWAGMRC